VDTFYYGYGTLDTGTIQHGTIANGRSIAGPLCLCRRRRRRGPRSVKALELGLNLERYVTRAGSGRPQKLELGSLSMVTGIRDKADTSQLTTFGMRSSPRIAEY
jgi:hypothetical protein